MHRDVKPANVLLDDDGNAYLSDFGIAEDLRDWRDNVSPEGLGYSAPELLRGEDVTPSADIFALGMIAQDLVNGRGGDPRVAGVIGRATADDPKDRFRDAEELARALREALGSPTTTDRTERGEERNPYKGLHSFVEADADDFFGRDALIDSLVARLAEPVEGARFLAVVGASGSGKSSAVRAGLIPTLRAGALPGSDRWFYLEMLPGSHPFEELESALQHVAVDPPSDLLETLEASDDGLAQVVGRILPDDGTELVLVVDQLEEVFTMVEDEQLRNRFLRSLVAATQGPDARLRVIVTLRADFFDRPLAVPRARRADADAHRHRRAAHAGGAGARDRRPGGAGRGRAGAGAGGGDGRGRVRATGRASAPAVRADGAVRGPASPCDDPRGVPRDRRRLGRARPPRRGAVRRVGSRGAARDEAGVPAARDRRRGGRGHAATRPALGAALAPARSRARSSGRSTCSAGIASSRSIGIPPRADRPSRWRTRRCSGRGIVCDSGSTTRAWICSSIDGSRS